MVLRRALHWQLPWADDVSQMPAEPHPRTDEIGPCTASTRLRWSAPLEPSYVPPPSVPQTPTRSHKEKIQRLTTALQAARETADEDLIKSVSDKLTAAQAERSDARPLGAQLDSAIATLKNGQVEPNQCRGGRAGGQDEGDRGDEPGARGRGLHHDARDTSGGAGVHQPSQHCHDRRDDLPQLSDLRASGGRWWRCRGEIYATTRPRRPPIGVTGATRAETEADEQEFEATKTRLENTTAEDKDALICEMRDAGAETATQKSSERGREAWLLSGNDGSYDDVAVLE